MSTPPPSPRLLEAIAGMRPVRTRSPMRTLLVLAVLWSAFGAIPLVAFRLRPDLAFLPVWWVAVVGFLWWLGFPIGLASAVLPVRGQVLPGAARAAWAAALITAVLLVVSALLPAEAPGRSISIPLLIGIRNCVSFALIQSMIPMAMALFALKRVVFVGSWRIGAALGAAAGALAGFILHLLCPVSSAVHVVLAHGGGVVACALVGAAVASRVLR
jgi:hypothetical protein